jgi:predicted CXXCH cytochrome family protein
MGNEINTLPIFLCFKSLPIIHSNVMKAQMKKLIINLFLVLISIPSFAKTKGSVHDFSSRAWAAGEICIVCHVPHNSNRTVPDAPLWGHAITTKVFTPYTTTTMKAVVGQPDGATKLCLSCHDGTVAIDSIIGRVGTSFIGDKIDLRGSGHWQHPMSIIYDTNLSIADTRLNDPAKTITSLKGTIAHDLLKNNKVQCTSCHDVHNNTGIGTLLYMNESTLCKTCHKNGL